MTRRDEEGATKIALDLQNPAQLCLLLKKQKFRCEQAYQILEANKKDDGVHTVVERDLKMKNVNYEAGNGQRGHSTAGDGAAPSVGRQMSVLLNI